MNKNYSLLINECENLLNESEITLEELIEFRNDIYNSIEPIVKNQRKLCKSLLYINVK